MNIERSCHEKKRFWSKNLSMRFRFLATVIGAMLAVAIFIGGISVYEVDKYIQNRAQEFVSITCDNEGSKINDSLGNMEKSVKIMESYLMDFFKSESDIEDPAFRDELVKSAEQMFSDVIKHTSNSGAIAYYFRLDPSVSDSKAGLFYSKLNGSSEFFSLEPTDLSIYEKDDTEHVGWFWQPYEAGEAIWMEPYHNQNNDVLMISYVIPMYFEERFIGVVGMDFDYIVLAEQVHEIKVYDNGFAYLESDGVVVCSDRHEFDHETVMTSPKYLRVSRDLVNGMTLTLSASYADIRQIRDEITFKIIFAVLILFALVTIIAIFIIRRIVDPLKKLTDASVRLSGGDYGVEFVRSDTHELNLLSEAFEDMAKRLCEREALLRRSANYDSLTSLQNTTSYTSWSADFDKQIESKGVDFGIIVLDLNNLKKTNDEFGHGVGDELIVASARIISDVFRASPAFRIGGDEFLVVLQGDNLDNCEKLLSKFETNCSNTFIDGNAEISVSIAFGFARFDSGRDARLKDVIKRADAAMYEHKRKNRS